MKLKNKTSKLSLSGSLLMICIFTMTILSGCKKYLDIPLPTNSVAGDGAYVSDNSTSAVVTGIYYQMYNQSTTFSGQESIGFRSGLYTDELQNQAPGNTSNAVFYTNTIQNANVPQWTAIYQIVYQANIAIEGINSTTSTLTFKNQWLGEALFMRAYLYYYLVNLYGDVPLITKSNFADNNKIGRTPKAAVYQQIITDLTQAQNLLNPLYKDGYAATTTVRARPNQFAANALLARVYLETGDWVNAETQATKVISSTTYQMVPPAQTFVAASGETIWGLSPTTPGFVREFSLYNNNMPAVLTGTNLPTSYGVTVSLSQSLVASFETGDARLTNWVRTSTGTTPATTYYFPNKYKSNTFGNEFCVELRLAEQYLIRAEARAQQSKLTGTNSAKSDLDVVRTRAGLTGSVALTQSDMLDAILKERRVELFTENGFRFFDLKRTGKIDQVMSVAAALKGGTWASFKQIWPIPTFDIQANANLTQSPGYQ